jgi:hypothetical protein
MFGVSLGIRVGNTSISGGGVDADAQAYFDRVTTAGGTLTTTEKTAVNQLVIDLKANGTWTPMKAIYPMVGSSAAACAQNLKSSSFTGSFSSGWTFDSNGATGNGTSAYMDTNFTPNTSLTLNSGHLSFYSRTNNTTGIDDIGAYNGTADLINMRLIINLSGTLYCDLNNGTTARIAVVNSNSLGFYLGSRISSTAFKVFKNNTTFGTNSNLNTGSQPTIPIYIGSSNATGTKNYSNRQCAFASIGDGLTDTQAAALYTNIQTFQTTLSRAITP